MARELTEKQEAYCLAVADIDSETYGRPKESAIAAGYASETAGSQAWKLKNDPKIILRVQELKAGQVDKSGLNASKILCDLEDNRRKSMQSNTEGGRSNARECSKLQGAYLDMWKLGGVSEPELKQLSEREKEEARKIAAIRLSMGDDIDAPDDGTEPETKPVVENDLEDGLTMSDDERAAVQERIGAASES